MTGPHQHCSCCAALRDELEQVRALSRQQAHRDYQHCAHMFLQLQQLAELNASLAQRCGERSGVEPHKMLAVATSARVSKLSSAPVASSSAADRRASPSKAQVQCKDDFGCERLQALVVQLAKENDALRAKLSSSITIPSGCQVQTSALIFSHEDDLSRDEVREGRPHGECDSFDVGRLDAVATSTREEEDVCGTRDERYCIGREQLDMNQNTRRQHLSHLRKLPLTSLHAQLKRRDTEIQRLQQLASKLEAQVASVAAKKQETARSYREITRVQQQQLKKYFALLRRLGSEKRALESKLADLDVYVAVLEKKLVEGGGDGDGDGRDGIVSSARDLKTCSIGASAITREWSPSIKIHSFTKTTKRALPSESKQLSGAAYTLNVRAG